MGSQQGISCDKIILDFNAHNREFIPILNKYLSNILVKFTNELSQTSTFKCKYDEYCNNLQMNILDSLNEKEIEQMIKILPIEIKREIDIQGKHKITLNDKVITLAYLKNLTDKIGSIFEQNDMVQLIDEKYYLSFIDQMDLEKSSSLLNK